MKVREIMTPDPKVLTTGDDVASAARLMRAEDVGFVPIVDDMSHRELVGVITDRDIAVRCVAESQAVSEPLGSFMSKEHIHCAEPEEDVHELMQRMERDQVRRIPVVDDHHRVIGVVAQADLARKVGPSEPAAVEHVLEAISRPAGRMT